MKYSGTKWAVIMVAAISTSVLATPYYDWMNDYTGSEANTMALFKFDDPDNRGYDASANDWVMSFSSTGTYTDATGKFGNAFLSTPRFTTVDGFMTIAGSGGGTGMWNGSAMSVEFWFRPDFDLADLGAWNTLIDNNRNGTLGGIWLRLNGTGSLHFRISNGVAGTATSTTTADLEWDRNTWYHLAVTFETVDDDVTLKIFRDGNLLADRTVENFGEPTNRDRNWKFANRDTTGYGSVPGYYDNVRISNVAYDFTPIPEPSGLLLMAFPALLLGGILRRRRFQSRG